MTALTLALAPIAKLCMKSGMGAGELQIAVKLACISVAAESAKLGNRLNHSRIAATTGLTRKEVRTLFGIARTGGIGKEKEVAKQRTNRVLHGWQTDPEFIARNGNPLALTIRGPGLTFHTLVRRYAGDVTPISVLNELKQLGAVSVSTNGRVAVRKSTLRVKGYSPEVVAEVAYRLRDLGTTLVDNIERPETPIFVGFNDIHGLSADQVTEFHTAFSGRAASLLGGVGRWQIYNSRSRPKLRRKIVSGARVGLGVFLIGQPSAGTAANKIRTTKTESVRRAKR